MDLNHHRSVSIVNTELGSQMQKKQLLEVLISKINCEQEDVDKIEVLKAILSVLPEIQEITVYYALLQDLVKLCQRLLEANIYSVSYDRKIALLQDNLKCCIIIIDILDFFMDDFIDSTIAVFHTIAKPAKSTTEILQLTFSHCKRSRELYGEYFGQLTEIVALFKKAQIVHSKLLKLLINSEITEPDAHALLEILEILLDVSAILSGLNVKSMVDNWKHYVMVIEKHVHILKSNNFKISIAVTLLTEEINKNVNALTVRNSGTEDVLVQTVKVIGFLLKVFTKLLQLFSENPTECCKDAVQTAVALFKFSPIYVNFQRCLAGAGDKIYFPLQQFLKLLLGNEGVCRCLTKKTCYNFDEIDHISFLLFSEYLLNERSSLVCFNVCDFLEVLLYVIGECCKEFFHTITVTSVDIPFYDHLLARVVYSIGIDHVFTTRLQNILIASLFAENGWRAIFAADVLCSCIRFLSPHDCLWILCSLTTYRDPFNALIYRRLEFAHLKSVIRRCYDLLEDEQKIEFADKFELQDSLDIWHTIGLKSYPLSHRHHINRLFDKATKIFGMLENGRLRVEDFKLLCHCLETLAMINYSQFHIMAKQLTNWLAKFWNFEAESRDLYSNKAFVLFIEKLLTCSNSVLSLFDDIHLILILTQIKCILEFCDNIKMLTLKLCNLLTQRTFEEKDSILSLVADILTILLRDANVVTSITAVEVLNNFLIARVHKDVIIGYLSNAVNVSNLPHSKQQESLFEYECADHIELLDICRSAHVCPKFREICIVKHKKTRFDNDYIKQRIDQLNVMVEELHKACDGQIMSSENSTAIDNIIKQLEVLL